MPSFRFASASRLNVGAACLALNGDLSCAALALVHNMAVPSTVIIPTAWYLRIFISLCLLELLRTSGHPQALRATEYTTCRLARTPGKSSSILQICRSEHHLNCFGMNASLQRNDELTSEAFKWQLALRIIKASSLFLV